MGDAISKIYKIKDRLVVNLPFDFIKSLSVREGDEIDFLPHGAYYIVAKKSALAEMMLGGAKAFETQGAAGAAKGPQQKIADDELKVLRKIDTIRYGNRTKEKLKELLDIDERRVLQRLIKKRFVRPFKKPGDAEFKYGISKPIYDSYLYRKQAAGEVRQASVARAPAPVPLEAKKWEQKLSMDMAYVSLLEANGYLVISNQEEASLLSKSLEASIRGGMVVGIRAFNRKYYIALKAFVARNAPRMLKLIQQKGKSVTDIAKETEMDEEGVRAVLYILSENGEVTELKRDFFRAIA